MSKNEKKNNAVVTKAVIENIVSKVNADKTAYDTCYGKLESACKLITEVIVISKDETNIIPVSTVARFVHLLGKLSNSNKVQFKDGYELIAKRQAKLTAKIERESKKAEKAKSDLVALTAKVKKLTKDAETKTAKAKEITEKLSAVKI